MTPETNPIPSQNARDDKARERLRHIIWNCADEALSVADAIDLAMVVVKDERIAAEQRGMEKAADEVERLRAENASLRAEIERLISQTVAVPRLDR